MVALIAVTLVGVWAYTTLEATVKHDLKIELEAILSADIAALSGLPAILAGLHAMKDWSGTDALPNIASETLVLWGDGDRTYPWSQTQLLWETIRDSQLGVVSHCAHAVHMERPAIFNALVNDFLDNVRA